MMTRSMCVCFFFSSRRRHTRSDRDWSSDVCFFRSFGAYGQSKLAQVLFTRELARRLEGTRVTVNACHPGVIRTNLGMGGTSAVVRFVRLFFKGPEKGAQTPIYLAVSPEVERVTGQYFANKHVREPSRAAQDPDVARRLFDVSAQLAHLSV